MTSEENLEALNKEEGEGLEKELDNLVADTIGRIMRGEVEITEEETERGLKEDADQGDETALEYLGVMYWEKGRQTEAVHCFQQAAEKGAERAQCFLAEHYEEGLGVEKNLELAFSWMEKSALQGYSEAEYKLAKYYANGIGTEPNETLAVAYLHKAAEKNYPPALFELGQRHRIGKGVNLDKTEALDYYAMAWISAYAEKTKSDNLRLLNEKLTNQVRPIDTQWTDAVNLASTKITELLNEGIQPNRSLPIFSKLFQKADELKQESAFSDATTTTPKVQKTQQNQPKVASKLTTASPALTTDKTEKIKKIETKVYTRNPSSAIFHQTSSVPKKDETKPLLSTKSQQDQEKRESKDDACSCTLS